MIAGMKLIDGEEIKISVTGNSNIVQSNYMISHKEHWTVAEERLFTTILAMMDVGDKELHLYKIPISTFVDLWNVDKGHVYTEVKKVLISLQQKGIYNREHTFDRTPALTRAIYDAGSDYVEVQIHPDLQEHLINIKVRGGYTKYKFENSLKLNRAKAGVNTNRIYELCRSYARKGKTVTKSISIEELRKVLDLGEKYKQLRDFEKRVLKIAAQKINTNTDLQVSYAITGKGKKAVINFTVALVQREAIAEPQPEPDNVPDAPALPDVPQPEPEPLPDEPPDLGGLYEKNPHDELVDMVLEELQKLPNYESTRDEAEYLLQLVLNQNIHDYVSVSDYVRTNVLYARKNWKRVRKSHEGYLKKVFAENCGLWVSY